MASTGKECCPTCGQSVNERQISLFTGMVTALWRVFMWCNERDQWEFSRQEIKHLFAGNENQIARFGDWILFGGLVYRPADKGKGHYGINRGRAYAFFAGDSKIPTSIWKNPMLESVLPMDYKFIGQIKNLSTFLDDNQQFIARYRPVEPGKSQFRMF